MRLSADIYCDSTGKLWSASIMRHDPPDFCGKVVWEKHGMRTEYNAETSMEAAYSRLENENGPPNP